ncbi:hypothetical protein Tco_1018086, partial [Tanacetum coccineum]
PWSFWPEAENWAAHVLNRCPTTAVKDKTPKEVPEWINAHTADTLYTVFEFLLIDYDEVQQLEMFATTNDPANFEEAVKYAKWREAMNLKIQAIKRNETWEQVDLPKNATTIGVKWVFACAVM